MPKAQRRRSPDDTDLRGLTIPPELAKQLRCPRCVSPLRFLSDPSGGRAARCRNAVEPHEYPVIDGIPILLDPEQSVFDQPVGKRAAERLPWSGGLAQDGDRAGLETCPTGGSVDNPEGASASGDDGAGGGAETAFPDGQTAAVSAETGLRAGQTERLGPARVPVANGGDYDTAAPPSFAARLHARLPSLGTNRQAARNYRRFAELLLSTPARPKVLVLGGARLGAGLEAIVDIASIHFVESDVYLGPRTSLVCDAHWIPFEDGSFDGVIAQAVIEHVADPAACAAEIHRILKPRGLVYADTPFMQQVHAGAYDFTRFTHLGQRRLFRKFDEVSSGPTCGPGMALAWAYQYFLLSFVRGPRARAAAITFARLTAFWLKWFDSRLLERPGAFDAASAYYFLGMKSDRVLSDRELIAQYRGLQTS